MSGPAPRSDFYEIRHEKSRIMHDKEALQVMYEDLLEQFNSLKDQHVRSPPYHSSPIRTDWLVCCRKRP